MKNFKKIKTQISISIIILLTGFGLTALYPIFLYNVGLVFIACGLIGIVVSPIIRHINTKKNSRLLGIYLLFFSTLNIARHYTDFYILSNFKEFWNEFIGIDKTIHLISLGIWIILTGIILKYTVELFTTSTKYEDMIKTKLSKLVLVFVVLIFLLEFPIYNWHPDFLGNMHGHSFWDRWHIH